MSLACASPCRLITPTGFVDMKEQVLPLIASRYDVRVIRRRRPTGLPLRTLEDYIQSLRFHHRLDLGRIRRSGVDDSNSSRLGERRHQAVAQDLLRAAAKSTEGVFLGASSTDRFTNRPPPP